MAFGKKKKKLRGETGLPVDSILISRRREMDKGRQLRREEGRKIVPGVGDRWTNAIPLSLIACGKQRK